MAQKSKISSRENYRFKIWKSLLTSDGIKKHGLFLLSGPKFVNEAKKSSLIVEALVPENCLETFDKPTFELSRELFKELDLFNTTSPLLIGSVPRVGDENLNEKSPEPAVMTALGHPDNLGSLIRSCEAFGVTRIILLRESAHPFHPKSLRASAGGALRCRFFKGPSIQNLELVNDILALDLNGQNILEFLWPKNFRLLIGSEGRGVPQGLECIRLHIPMAKNVESLNGAVSASIALFQRFKNSK